MPKNKVKKEIVKKLPFKGALDVHENIRSLMKLLPRLGYIIVKIKWQVSNIVPTAGISHTYKLYINKGYFESITKDERVAVLKHEALHIAHRHWERLIDVSQPYIAEIAKEISINQYIDGLPEGCLNVNMFNLDKGLTLEDYYKKLLKIAENNSKDLKNKSDGNPLKGDSKDLKGNPILGDKICKDAEEYAESIGKESGNMFEKVEILPTNYKAKINALVGCQPSTTKIKRSYSRRSKRFVKSPGLKKELELGNCIFGLDTSGSMSQEELGKALDVAKKIRHKCSKLTMIQGDTEVKDISSVKKNVREMTIKGRGGTTLTPIVEKAKEFGYPKVPLIMFTDGDVWDYPPKEQLKNSVWVFTKGSNAITFSKSHPGVKYAVMM